MAASKAKKATPIRKKTPAKPSVRAPRLVDPEPVLVLTDAVDSHLLDNIRSELIKAQEKAQQDLAGLLYDTLQAAQKRSWYWKLFASTETKQAHAEYVARLVEIISKTPAFQSLV